MDNLGSMDKHNSKDLRDALSNKDDKEMAKRHKEEFERQRQEIANHQEDYYNQTFRNIKNFIPSGINPDNNAFFEEQSNPLSSKGD